MRLDSLRSISGRYNIRVTGALGPAARDGSYDRPAIEITDEPTAVYRFYDEADRLLYVGISRNPAARWAQHAVEKKWWPRVDRFEDPTEGMAALQADMDAQKRRAA